jgi:hypothetical protein
MTSICGLAFIGEFEGRDDAQLPLDGRCPECTEYVDPGTGARDELIAPSPLVEAAVMAVEAYEHGGAGELDGTLARLACEVERAGDGADPESLGMAPERHRAW